MSTSQPNESARQDGGADFREKLVELLPFLRAFARTLSGHRDDADDLCQEALVKAWAEPRQFRTGHEFEGLALHDFAQPILFG